MSFRSQKKSLMADINVVPYVDVMLVLLIIFMVTAPLLTQGVEVELPNASAEVLPKEDKPPLVVSVDSKGQLFLDQEKEALEPKMLAVKVQAALRIDPKRAVLVRGDKNIDYGQVVSAMVLLQRAGVAKVGLVTLHEEGS